MKKYLNYLDAKKFSEYDDVKILYDYDDGYLLYSEKDGMTNAAAFSLDGAVKVKNALPKDVKLISLRGEQLLALFCNDGWEVKDECYQAQYHGTRILITENNYSFRFLTPNDIGLIEKYYPNREYVYSLLEKGVFIGVFDGDELVGSIGEHARGSMGLLQIKETHRKKGLGFLLEATKINSMLSQGRTPVCHIVVTNTASLALQRKLKMTFLPDKVYWLKKHEN